MTDDEVDALLSGIEDSQGQVNYEGTILVSYSLLAQVTCLSFPMIAEFVKIVMAG